MKLEINKSIKDIEKIRKLLYDSIAYCIEDKNFIFSESWDEEKFEQWIAKCDNTIHILDYIYNDHYDQYEYQQRLFSIVYYHIEDKELRIWKLILIEPESKPKPIAKFEPYKQPTSQQEQNKVNEIDQETIKKILDDVKDI